MTVDTTIADLLACPRCDKALTHHAETGIHCSACQLTFPDLDGVPVLAADPTTTLGEWRQRHHMLLEKLAREQHTLDAELADKSLPELTRKRLTHLAEAKAKHVGELKVLLQPLELTGYQASYDTYLALRTRLPSDHGLNTYYPNIHRDWAWGDDENQRSTDLVMAALEGVDDGPQLVLGAGAGRLAYDLALGQTGTPTIALDFNPMLLLVAAAVCRGDSVTLTEFPIAPKRLQDIAVTRELRAPTPASDNLQLIMADALRPPFKPQAFGTVITPWLVDVIPEPLDQFAARINQLLPKGGRWVIFGSLAFGQSRQRDQLAFEEVESVLTEAGFVDIAINEAQIPYMCSPSSRHGRQEQVVIIRSTKAKTTKRPPRAVSLPDWIVKGDSPVPLSESFQTQAASTRIYAFLMSLIDGKRSLKDMAQLVEQQQLMSATEAESSIRSFLIKMYEDSQRETTY
ncbi:MAG: hypothetical protein V3R81_02015 [Gammaproteobacteria bacterium]